MTFRQAVGETPSLAHAWQPGLQALKRIDKPRVKARDPRRIAGSVDVDSALARQHQHDSRWDYAIGHRPKNQKNEIAYWVEVHPANAREVNVVLAKLKWLKAWLAKEAPELKQLRREFIWVSSGKTSFTLSSPQQKSFALLGLQHKGRVFEIPDEAVY